MWVQALIPVTVALIPGFWTFLLYRRQKKDNTKDNLTRLVMGHTYDRIVTRGMSYIERGWITKDEYEDFRNYFYDPYKALGGNGVAERIMADVSSLPFKSPRVYYELNQPRSEQEYRDDRRIPQGFSRASIEQP